MGSYTCLQKVMNSISVETTEFYMKKIKEEEERVAQIRRREREREDLELSREKLRKKQRDCQKHGNKEDKNKSIYTISTSRLKRYFKNVKTVLNISQFDYITQHVGGTNESTNMNMSTPVYESNSHQIKVESVAEREDINNSFQNPFRYCLGSWWKFLIVVMLIIVLSIITIWILPPAPLLFIWSCCGCVFIIITLSTYISWELYTKSSVLEEPSTGRIIIPILASVFCIFSFFTPCMLCERLDLLQLIFVVVAKTVMAIPRLPLFIAAITFAQLIILILFILGAVQIMTTTQLKSIAQDHYEFDELSHFAKFSLILIVFVANWTMQVFAGFQWMTVAGSVASCYFEDEPQTRISYVYENFSRTLCHIGTIMYGSLFQPWVTMINYGIKFFTCSYGYGVCLFKRTTKAQIFLETYSKNAFIETALHGQSFSRSGKRAFNVLLTYAPGVIAVNNMGNAFVFISEFNVITIATAISYGLFSDSDNIRIPTATSFILNTVIIIVLFRTFQITMHTISLCFCEDRIVNDGYLLPYYASNELEECMEKIEEHYVKPENSDEEQASTEAPRGN